MIAQAELIPETTDEAKEQVAVRSSAWLEHPARIVALSGGKDSTAMAIELAEREPSPDYQFCITPTKRELPAMEAHWAKLERLLGKPLVRIPAPSLVELIVKYKTLPNWRMRFCTRQIKIEPFMAYAAKLAPAISYVGIRADEVIGDGKKREKPRIVQHQNPMATSGYPALLLDSGKPQTLYRSSRTRGRKTHDEHQDYTPRLIGSSAMSWEAHMKRRKELADSMSQLLRVAFPPNRGFQA